MSRNFWRQPSLVLGALVSIALLTAVACGATEEPTPTPPPAPVATNTPTPPSAVATPTPTTTTAVVATPTPTRTPTPSPVPSVQPKRGGIVRLSGGEDPASFDAHTATSSAHVVHNALMYSNLVWRPKGDEIVMDAAESYTISADGKVFTFKLRPNVKFQTGYKPAHPRDGTAMTSKDAKWSLEKIMGLHGQTISARSGWMKEFIDIDRPDNGIEVVDDLTFKIHLIQPFPGLVDILAIGFSAIYPEGIVKDDLKLRPYGSGAFRLKDFQRGALWQYERNPDYFKPGLPYLDGINHVNMDGTAIIQAAFLTNKLDLSGGNPTKDNEATYKARADRGEIYILPYVTTCRPQSVNMNHTKPPFNDIKLRQAVNLAIDRQGYIEVVHDGYAQPHFFLDTGGVGRSVQEILKAPGYRQPHDADLAEAKKIISELYPSGLDVKMMARNSSGYMRQNEFIAGELRKVGINVTLDPQDSSVVFPRAEKLDYTIWSYYFCLTTETPEELFGSYFITGGSRNWIGFSNPDMDRGYLDLAATADPIEKRRKALALEDIILKELPVAPLPVQSGTRTAYSYVRDLPLTKGKQYTWPKNELIWRSDI
ncbi:MAG: ABC transporter substrate-binding protein [Chloroflexi bacterium]|nr:ABC transporter substrate-binding protein [Chloroflexota bacterium]